LFGFLESLKILSQHPLTGLGPGMFGSLASILWSSPVYDSWPEFFKEFAFRIRCIDQFWPWIWGEFGIVGLIIYGSGLLSLFLYLGRASETFKIAEDRIPSRIGKTLQYFLVALAIMGMAGGLNAAFVTYTYFALVGMLVSLAERRERVNVHACQAPATT